MKKSTIEVGKVYRSKSGKKFRLVTGLGPEFKLISGQTDLDCVQYLACYTNKAGQMKVSMGLQTNPPGKEKDADEVAAWFHTTRTSFASWAHCLATDPEAELVRNTLKLAGVRV